MLKRKVPLPEGSESKSYYKYFSRDLAPVPEEKLEVAAAGPRPNSGALLIEDRDKLLDMGYLPYETGYWVLEDGSGALANNTYMPGVTCEMLQWWFAWHALDPLRYAIWDPEDHFDVKISDEVRRKILDPDIPLEEKSWDVLHEVVEAFEWDQEPEDVTIKFENPWKMGFNRARYGKDSNNCGFLVAVNGESGPPDHRVNAVMVHMARPVEGGVEFRTRFWNGWKIDAAGKAVKTLPDGIVIPAQIPETIYRHNIKEYSNLATLLPLVYAEERDRW